MTYVTVAALMAFGIIAPHANAARAEPATSAEFFRAVVFLLVVFAHTVSLGKPITVAGQSLALCILVAYVAAATAGAWLTFRRRQAV